MKFCSLTSIVAVVAATAMISPVAVVEANPDLFICGHSHILKVMYDKKYKLLHMNPGAIGDFGIHTVKTILCFSIDGITAPYFF